MANFYKDSTNDYWIVNDYIVPPATCVMVEESATDISIKSIHTDKVYLPRIAATSVLQEDGITAYASVAALKLAGKDFFFNTAVIVKAFNLTMGSSWEVDSVHGYLERDGGDILEKTITLDANNTTASVNLFQITKTLQVFRLHAEIVDATVLNNLTAASFDLWDGTAAYQITAATGVLSGVLVDTYIVKDELAAQPFTICDPATGGVLESGVTRTFTPFKCWQKKDVDTFLRFTYTTTDAPINAQLTARIEFRALGNGTLVAV